MGRDFAKKVVTWFAREQPWEYAAIADWAAEKKFPVTFMGTQLGVVGQGYYRWLATGGSERERADAELADQIREIHTELRGDPGVRRVGAVPLTRKPPGRGHLPQRPRLPVHLRGTR
ncbi:MAG: hypothetical protein ACRDTG_27035 [Pseudonocardiaceae bacterium]